MLLSVHILLLKKKQPTHQSNSQMLRTQWLRATVFISSVFKLITFTAQVVVFVLMSVQLLPRVQSRCKCQEKLMNKNTTNKPSLMIMLVINVLHGAQTIRSRLLVTSNHTSNTTVLALVVVKSLTLLTSQDYSVDK